MDRMLLIETSGRIGRVGIAAGRTLLAERRLDEKRRHARDLAPAVADLLREQAWTPRDLAAVVVGIGPGSYTGLRVGIMSAKALAFATGCRLVGVPTFHVLAFQAETPAAELVLVADAQREKVYFQTFRRAAAGAEFQSAIALAARDAGELMAVLSPHAAVGGPGLEKVRRHVPAEMQIATAADEPSLAGLLAIG